MVESDRRAYDLTRVPTHHGCEITVSPWKMRWVKSPTQITESNRAQVLRAVGDSGRRTAQIAQFYIAFSPPPGSEAVLFHNAKDGFGIPAKYSSNAPVPVVLMIVAHRECLVKQGLMLLALLGVKVERTPRNTKLARDAAFRESGVAPHELTTE